jgi:hypothetical protein
MIVRITRVKVGNRQAPQQCQKPHPEKVGFLRLQGGIKAGKMRGAVTARPCAERPHNHSVPANRMRPLAAHESPVFVSMTSIFREFITQ